MSLFLALFFFLYSGMHFYAYRKLSAAFPLPLPGACFVIAGMLVMIFAPLFVRLLERSGFGSVAVPLAYAGYLWMGFLFLFFVVMLAIDLGGLVVRCIGWGVQRDCLPYLAGRHAFILASALALVISCYAYHEALAVGVENVVIPTTKLPATVKSLKIAQISDVHLGLVVQQKRLARIVREIEKVQPDLLVSTGDLIDGQTDGMATLADALVKVRPRFGKFAVTGNHEYYAGIENSLSFMNRAGFVVLQGEARDIGGLIAVVGVDDPAGMRFGSSGIPEEKVLKQVPPGQFVLLLKHRPLVNKGSVGSFDLQLSGHVHKGQIFPFGMVTYLFYPVKTGLTMIMDCYRLYISRGTGTWGPPLRFLAPPEITVIELVRSSVKE
ncbi:MAG: metallophosphoesterase [Geobacteraceae bacterium]|nr:metallophosphoesterase [Geobacteraceae bacterium]